MFVVTAGNMWNGYSQRVVIRKYVRHVVLVWACEVWRVQGKELGLNHTGLFVRSFADAWGGWILYMVDLPRGRNVVVWKE